MSENPLKIERAISEDLSWPNEVNMVLSALEAGQHNRKVEQRMRVRLRYRVRAKLRLFSDLPDTAPWVLYTRDVEPRSLGFVTQHRLPLGYGGQIELANPDGNKIVIPCTLLRCRAAAPGWYEGALYFNREQDTFTE